MTFCTYYYVIGTLSYQQCKLQSHMHNRFKCKTIVSLHYNSDQQHHLYVYSLMMITPAYPAQCYYHVLLVFTMPKIFVRHKIKNSNTTNFLLLSFYITMKSITTNSSTENITFYHFLMIDNVTHYPYQPNV